MRSILTRKCLGVTRSDERGQGILEYLLVLAVVVGMFLLVGRPFLTKIAPKFQNLGKSGVFAQDSTGSNFYYFPIR